MPHERCLGDHPTLPKHWPLLTLRVNIEESTTKIQDSQVGIISHETTSMLDFATQSPVQVRPQESRRRTSATRIEKPLKPSAPSKRNIACARPSTQPALSALTQAMTAVNSSKQFHDFTTCQPLSQNMLVADIFPVERASVDGEFCHMEMTDILGCLRHAG